MPSRKKYIGIIVEGQTEIAFLYHFLLPHVWGGWDGISVECFPPPGTSYNKQQYTYDNSTSVIHFVLIDAGSDKGVITKAKDSYQGMMATNNYVAIIGIRDVFSEEYELQWKKKHPGRAVEFDEEIKAATIDTVKKSVSGLKNFHLYFSVMEIEAWLLAFFRTFKKVKADLTKSKITTLLGIDLSTIDPETLLKPSNYIRDLKIGYSKGHPQRITSQVTNADVTKLIRSGVCKSFLTLYNELCRLKSTTETQHLI
jgi:hypothetical protein